MAKVTVKIDQQKLKRDLNREIKKYGEGAIKGLTSGEKKFIADKTIAEMKGLVAKGISPIQGFARFPAYLWAGRASAALKATKRLKSSVARKIGRSQAKAEKLKHYPYSAQKKYPGKRERPVNLKLSGAFLNALTSKITNRIEIGFFKDPYDKYEQGHREGVHGQPERPIIPEGEETFSRSVYQELINAVRLKLALSLNRIIKRSN